MSVFLVVPVAGSGPRGGSGDGGPAVEAKLSEPRGLAVGPDGTIYIADRVNNRIRRVDSDGVIRAFAGTGQAGSSGDGGPATATGKEGSTGDDGPATEARIGAPTAVAVGPDGSVYFTDHRCISPINR
jgi:glucose/arabinose dehydrogenase